MSRTVSSVVAGPVVLQATDNPLTITSTGGVQSTADAIDGGAGTSPGRHFLVNFDLTSEIWRGMGTVSLPRDDII